MDMYNKFQSPLGYQATDSQIDSYGVDHSGFSTRDELEYQFARQNKENQLIQNYNNQGITKNYPQYGTNFWAILIITTVSALQTFTTILRIGIIIHLKVR